MLINDQEFHKAFQTQKFVVCVGQFKLNELRSYATHLTYSLCLSSSPRILKLLLSVVDFVFNLRPIIFDRLLPNTAKLLYNDMLMTHVQPSKFSKNQSTYVVVEITSLW